MSGDHHYPAYHFRPSAGMYGDPLGFFWDGEYHIFYQHNPIAQDEGAPLYGPASWGHTVSTDLVHWEALPAGPRAVTWDVGPGRMLEWLGGGARGSVPRFLHWRL